MRSFIDSTNGHQAPTMCICRCQGCRNKILVCEQRKGRCSVQKEMHKALSERTSTGPVVEGMGELPYLGVREALSEQVTSELRCKGRRFITILDKHTTQQLLHFHCTGEAQILDLSEHLLCRTVAHRALWGAWVPDKGPFHPFHSRHRASTSVNVKVIT